MGGDYRVRRELNRDQAASLVSVLLKVRDSSIKKRLEPYKEGWYTPKDFLPIFRQLIRDALEGDRCTPAVRLQLVEWGAKLGLQSRGVDEPNSRPVMTRLSASVYERLQMAAAADDTEIAVWVREAVIERLNRKASNGTEAE